MEDPEQKVVRVCDIVGFTDIAIRLGLQRHRTVMWHHRRATTGFPEAIARVNDSFVFDFQDIEEWYASWLRTRGWLSK